MRAVKLIQSVKTDQPYFICGDPPAVILLEDEAAQFAVVQGYGVYSGNVSPELPDEPVTFEPVGTLQKMDFDRDASSQSELEDSPEPEAPAKPKEPPKKPDGRNTQSVWAEWAAYVDEDMSLDRAKGMSKTELMSRYGQRF